MLQQTINRQETIEVFHQLMQGDSQFRLLRLLGEAKMGKTHLLSDVFPKLALGHYQARPAVVDLRGSMQNVPDILHNLCWLLGSERFPTYLDAHEKWLNRPLVEVKGLQGVLSRFSIQAGEPADETRKMSRHLTYQFVTDLHHLTDTNLLLLFDALEQAEESIRSWLMDQFLVQVAPLAHVRMVLAGQAMPEASGSYAACCLSHELLSVRDEKEYISFCRHNHLDLGEQSIRDIMRLFDYKPGLFVDWVMPRFTPQRGGYG